MIAFACSFIMQRTAIYAGLGECLVCALAPFLRLLFYFIAQPEHIARQCVGRHQKK